MPRFSRVVCRQERSKAENAATGVSGRSRRFSYDVHARSGKAGSWSAGNGEFQPPEHLIFPRLKDGALPHLSLCTLADCSNCMNDGTAGRTSAEALWMGTPIIQTTDTAGCGASGRGVRWSNEGVSAPIEKCRGDSRIRCSAKMVRLKAAVYRPTCQSCLSYLLIHV